MTTLTKELITLKLKQVMDPEVDMNIVDLGLVYDIDIYDESVVEVRMTLTSQGCPMGEIITEGVKNALSHLRDVTNVVVSMVWEPQWSPKKINPLALKARDLHPNKLTVLDVRPILASGGEPFGAIMQAVNKIPQDGALKLIATFKPAPLLGMLASQGFQNWIETAESDNWTIWFFKTNEKVDSPVISKSETEGAHLQKDHPELRDRLHIKDNTWTLDVRRMVPPEPMQLTLVVLEKLPENITLVQINERAPQMLLNVLADRGFSYEVQEPTGKETEVRTSIRRK